MDDATLAIIEELYNVDVYTRIYGDRWLKFLDDLAERYAEKPNMSPRLSIRITERKK